MSTAIQWTDETWNPVTGCTRVSEGCRNCYIERTPPFRMHGRKLGDRVQLHPDRLDQPLRWTKPRRVFVNSLSDLFHEDAPDSFIEDVYTIMLSAPRHTFQILTKRPDRAARFYHEANWERVGEEIYKRDPDVGKNALGKGREGLSIGKHIWLGVSIEDQKTADERIPILLQTPAAVRFVSYEPALGPVDLSKWVKPVEFASCWEKGYKPTEDDYKAVAEIAKAALKRAGAWDRLDWVIAGGESGPGARSCDVAHLRSIVQQCKAAGVPVFVKQLGAKPILSQADQIWMINAGLADSGRRDAKGGDPAEWPADLRVREWPR